MRPLMLLSALLLGAPAEQSTLTQEFTVHWVSVDGSDRLVVTTSGTVQRYPVTQPQFAKIELGKSYRVTYKIVTEALDNPVDK